MIKKSEVCHDLKTIESRLIELKDEKCLLSSSKEVDDIISSISKLASSLTLGMTSSITGRKVSPEKCRFCGK